MLPRRVGGSKVTQRYAQRMSAALVSKPPTKPFRLRIVIALIASSAFGLYALLRILMLLRAARPIGLG